MNPIPDSVLVVDDDPGTCRSIRRILALDGYQVEIANSLSETLQDRDWKKFFAILLDRRLGDGTAEQLIPLVKEKAPAASIVVITGYADLEGAISAVREGVSDYILKPITPDHLRFRLTQLLDQRKNREAVQRHQEMQSLLADLMLRALKTKSLEDLFQLACNQLVSVLGMEYAKVLQLSRKRDRFHLIAGCGWQPGFVGTATVLTDHSTQAGYTLQTDLPVIVENVREETRFSAPPLLVDHQVVSGISVVIYDQSNHFGILGVHSRSTGTFSEMEVNFVQSVANLLGTAVERHRAQEELNRFFDLSQELSCILSPEGEFIRQNPAWNRSLGYSAEELKTLRLHELCDPSHREKFQQAFHQLREGTPLQQFRAPFRGADQTNRWLEWNATFDTKNEWVHAVARDVTADLIAAEQLQQERDFARQLIDTARALIVLLDQSGLVVRWNRFAEELTGKAIEEIQGQPFHWLALEESTRDDIFRSIAECIQGGSSELTLESQIASARGAARSVAWWGQTVHHEGEEYLLLIGHDLTELKATQARLLQSERLSAIGEMVTGLAHESRNSLQRAQACLEMLALDLEEEPEFGDLIRQIQRALSDLHRLYEEVRGYAAPLRLELHPVALSQLCETVWEELAASHHEKNLQFHLHVDAQLKPRLDGPRFGQVLRNIFDNAIIACPEGGEVFVEAEVQEELLHLRIRDTGPGLSLEVREQIFEPFYTTRTRGTGLGMAIAQRIVEGHHGSIQTTSHSPGAEILITLPLDH